MKHETDTPETANHKSMVALLIRLGANPDEAYNATEAMTSETKRVALDLVKGLKLQVLSRLEALHTALMGFKAEVAARFEAIDHRFEAMNHRFEAVDHRFGSIEREMRAGFKAIEQRFDGMEQGFDRMQAHLDGHLASYRKLLLLLVVPVAVAITAGIGGMIWKAISSWPTGLP
ncbi:MAG: hypothetical protein OXH83_03865 [Bryobacterales bacterium]|nr:hypothetical protein [Bryobacterales bacterium]